jgi:hypothetical protein
MVFLTFAAGKSFVVAPSYATVQLFVVPIGRHVQNHAKDRRGENRSLQVIFSEKTFGRVRPTR